MADTPIAAFFEDVFREQLQHDPELLTYLGNAAEMGLSTDERGLTDVSPDARRAEAQRAAAHLKHLETFADTDLTPAEQTSKRVLAWSLANQAAKADFVLHDYPLNQMEGMQVEFPNFMLTAHPLDSRDQVDAYLARLGAFATKADQILDALDQRAAKNMLPPDYVMRHVIKDIGDFVASGVRNNVLWQRIQALPAELREPGTASLTRMLESSVLPAYQRLGARCQVLLPACDKRDGVWKLPDGEAYYAWCLAHHTTTDLSADQIHQIGEEAVASIHAQMEDLFAQVNMQEGSIAERMSALFAEPRFRYEDSDAGRIALLADYRRFIDEAEERMKDWFAAFPRAKVLVKRIPEFKEQGAPGGYYEMPAADGSRPGIFYANLRDLAETPRFTMRTLAYHEASPGHHYQIARAQEMDGLPQFRRHTFFTAYTEGWALYCEKLAEEMGLLDDPYDRLGRLQGELLRAARLVVDTGLHAKRWSRERAIDYMVEQGTIARTDATTEVERYVVLPGQACSYKIGMNAIFDLRAKAEQALGKSFDIKAFHEVILGCGSVPLDSLEHSVAAYIQQSS